MEQVKDWDTFVAYFQEISTRHKDIKSFVFGSLEARLAFSRSQIEYPCLHLEIPDFFPQVDGQYVKLTSAFVISQNAEKGDYQAENQALKICFEIAMDIISKMRKDSYDLNENDNPFLEFKTSESSAEAGFMLGVDNEHGYRVEFSLLLPNLICYNENKFEE